LICYAHLGFDPALYGEFFKRQGDRSKTQQEIDKAPEVLRECGADGWIEKYGEELKSIGRILLVGVAAIVGVGWVLL
jgi:hypothetical protein